MAAGMKDVASLAGVAVGTVSNVLNHPDLVRPLTRARVEAAMEQLGFIPNAPPRQLRPGRSRCLGLVVLDVTNPFFTEVARGVEDYAQAAGYAVILCNSDEADDKGAQVPGGARGTAGPRHPHHSRPRPGARAAAPPRAGHPGGAARPAGFCRAVLGSCRRPPRRRDRSQSPAPRR